MAIQNANRPCVMGDTHTVAAGHYMSAQAGLQMLEAGANAIDTGVTAAIATGVLEGSHVSIGGLAPILGTEPVIAGKCRHPHPLMRDAWHDNAAPAARHA
jgi:gamma-glutamyltranspeptidase